MSRITHPQLGAFEGFRGEWQALQPITLRCTGHAAADVIIAAADESGEPSDEQFRALADLVSAPDSLRESMTDAIFRAYSSEFRSRYGLPEITAEGVWEMITGLYGIWVLRDASVSADFNVSFDEEHQLHVLVKDGVVSLVWME